jgi:glucosamine-phosphate N-acetyltransferase
MGIKIRHYRKGDFDKGLLECLNVLSPTEIDKSEHGFNSANNIQATRKYRGIKTYVAIDENKRVVGTASLLLERKFLRGGAYVAHIEDVAVLPEFQGQDVGTQLIEYCLDECRFYKPYKVILNCTPAIAPFYERFGFRRAGIQMRLDK